jgi:hydroxymethylbilane synthase
MTDPIRIGSRGSQLALWQANHIADALRAAGHAVEIEIIHTTGDRLATQPDAAQTESGVNAPNTHSLAPPPDGKGIFIKEIEEALAAGRIDLAVHSLKDLPTALDPRFTLAAIPPRADPRDAYVCPRQKALHTLPTGALVGTTSPRRRAQLLALRPDLRFVEMRGNIDTRLRKLADGECNALVLAAAGLDRLNRTEWLRQRFTIDEICPAPGQGALALETRAPGFTPSAGPTSSDPARDDRIRQVVAALDHPESRFSVEAERTVLDALGGGCQLPIGVHCAPIHDVANPIPNPGAPIAWKIQAQVVEPDGERMICLSTEVPAGVSARALGLRVAEDLKSRGALELLTPTI